jgi:hypothetical protein
MIMSNGLDLFAATTYLLQQLGLEGGILLIVPPQ